MPYIHKPTPPLMRTPMFCVTLYGQRFLDLGVFRTATLAKQAGDAFLADHPARSRMDMVVEPIYVSRRAR